MPVILAVIALAIGVVRSWFLWRSRHQRDWRWWLGWLVPSAALVLAATELGLIRTWLEVEKILGALIEPLGLLWLGLLALCLVAFVRRQRGWGLALLAVFVFDTVIGNEWLACAVMASLEHQVPAEDTDPRPFDAVEVLGGGTDMAPSGRAELSHAGDRVLRAFELYHQGRTHLLVASGSPVTGMERSPATGEETAAIWRALGVPGEDILTLLGPRTTSEEIRRVASEARARHWTRIGLVTSAWHMPRALRLCRAEALTVSPLISDNRGMMPPLSLVWVIPHGQSVEKLQLAAWEYLASIAHR